MLACSHLHSKHQPCQTYNCWTGKLIDEDGKAIPGKFIPLGKHASHNDNEEGAHGQRHSTTSELELSGLVLVFCGLGVFGVRWMHERGLITDKCRPNWARFGSLDIGDELNAAKDDDEDRDDRD